MRAHAVALVGLAAALACAEPESPARDQAAGALRPHGSAPPSHPSVVRSARYLTMRDGTRLAVDVTLPAGLADGERLPTVLHQTRYWRGVELRWPLSTLGDAPNPRGDRFARHGYAVVSLDARGSGASFGWRPHPWSLEEQRDAAEVVAWVVEQPWSNGRVATEGESYDGTAAELVVAQFHPAVRVVAPRHALYDGYLHMPFPGGVPQRGVLEAWSEANTYLDSGRLPPVAGLLNRLLVRGVRPADPDRAMLTAAIREHARNPDVSAIAATGAFRDDSSGDFSVARFSPHSRRDSFLDANVPLFSWSGWCDGAMTWAAVQRFRSVRTRGSRLLIGPWNHGGSHSCSPTSAGPSRFDPGAELRRFFDRFLREGAEPPDEPPVHYYTMVEDRWKSARDWPPPATPRALYFAGERALQDDPPSAQRGLDTHDVDFEARTGKTSRWDTVFTAGPVEYPDRAEQDARLLHYTSAPLAADLEVTGHPVVRLFVTSSAEDGAFFAYLEDVAPGGEVTYVTEGMLRALHRARLDAPSPLGPGLPLHGYRRADARPLVPGEPALLEFDLLPTSYRFRAGHAVRLALAGADRDHFLRIPAEGDVRWQVHRSRDRASQLVLPVIAN